MQAVVTATLEQLESRIERGLQTFVEVGEALLEIREGRLYRQRGFDRFDDYCRERWGFDRTRAHRLIQASEITQMLPIGNMPTNEAQTRELVSLRDNPEATAKRWERALS